MIIGHARITGHAAQALGEIYPSAKRLHFIHMIPDDIERFKIDRGEDAESLMEERHQAELELCESADYCAAVGPRIYAWFMRDLEARGLDLRRLLRFDPGFDSGETTKRNPPQGEPWTVLLFGRTEDEMLKGLDIAVAGFSHAAQRLHRRIPEVELLIRGALPGKAADLTDRARAWAKGQGLNIRVKPYTAVTDKLTNDLRAASLVVMPSRAEGFGLVGAEAIIAGTPALISSASGLGKLIVEVAPEDAIRTVVDTTGEDSATIENWSRAIEATLSNRDGAFTQAEQLRKRLADKVTWAASVSSLADTINQSAETEGFSGGRIIHTKVLYDTESQREERVKVDNRTEPDDRSVFVVHGRNEQLRKAMFEFLRAIDLKPIEWSEGVSLTGVGSPYIGDVLDAAFTRARAVVVLLTPDEIAYLQPAFTSRPNDPETQPAPQARPNVLFEAGMAMGRHPHHTILVEVGEMRQFSDVAGRHAVRMTNEIAARHQLAGRLVTAGCKADTTGTDWLTAGDFTVPPPPGQGLTIGRRVPSTNSTKPIDFDAIYHDSGSAKRAGKLQIINRGAETAYDIKVELPKDAALSFVNAQSATIQKIPGKGKSVNLTAWNQGRMLGGPDVRYSFDITVSARTEDGQEVTQDVFLDVN